MEAYTLTNTKAELLTVELMSCHLD